MDRRRPALTEGVSHSGSQWQVILRQPTPGKVVLYNSHSNQLAIESQVVQLQPSADHLGYSAHSLLADDRGSLRPSSFCPLCHHPFNLASSVSPTSHSQQVDPRQYPPPTQALSSFRALLPPGNNLEAADNHPQWDQPPNQTLIDASYFRLLSRTSTPQASRPVTPPTAPTLASSPTVSSHAPSSAYEPHTRGTSVHLIDPEDHEEVEPLGDAYRVDGYYQRFFVEDVKLGRGEKGSVFLCTHVLYGHSVGHFAVKKIAVGQSGPELLRVLREVKFLETLRHQNITQYHHAWIEKAQLSRFGPPVPVLFILMDYANGGTLDAYINTRKGTKAFDRGPSRCGSGLRPTPNDQAVTDTERRNQEKEQFRRRRKTQNTFFPRDPSNSAQVDTRNCQFSQSLNGETIQDTRHDTVAPDSQARHRARGDDIGLAAIHLFSLEEILNIFRDTCNGLAFLHSQGILHHDLKSENVLLHWEHEDSMTPKALISDFGSSIAQSENWRRERTGRTGTLDWVPPESLKKDPRTGRLYEVTQTGDMWQLGLLLHCLCFFRLPYAESDDIEKLREEIQQYPGYLLPRFSTYSDPFSSQAFPFHSQPAHRLDLPRSLMKLMADLLSVEAHLRPSCVTVLTCIESIRQSNLAPPSGSIANQLMREATKRKATPYSDRQSAVSTGGIGASNSVTGRSQTQSGQLTLIKRSGFLGFPPSDDQEPVATTFGFRQSDKTNKNDSQQGLVVRSQFKNGRLMGATKAGSTYGIADSHSRGKQKSKLAALRPWSNVPRTSPQQSGRAPVSNLSKAHLRKQIYMGLLVILKSILAFSLPKSDLAGPKYMLILSVVNVVEIIICSWLFTISLSLIQMFYLFVL